MQAERRGTDVPSKEREPARPRRTLSAKTQGLTNPSSATAGRKARNSAPTLPRRSLERVVRRVELGVWGTEDRRPTGGGMTGTAAGKSGPKLATTLEGKP